MGEEQFKPEVYYSKNSTIFTMYIDTNTIYIYKKKRRRCRAAEVSQARLHDQNIEAGQHQLYLLTKNQQKIK